MSARRQYSDKHALPKNPSLIEFQRSDGDQSVWPQNTVRVVDHEGHVNFMDPVELDQPIGIKWRVQVGSAMALALGYPEGPSYVLKGWPDGYKMFDHHKGKADAPRHDVYLFGPPKHRFRSVPEFVPHAIWLMEDPSLDTSNCKCKYCSKKAQRDITSSMANIMRSTSGTQSPGPSRIARNHRENKPYKNRDLLKAREQRFRDHKVYSAVQRAPKPSKLPTPSKQPMVRERNSDLRAVHGKTGMLLKRWFREGELLWCALDPPIPGRRGDSDSIKFWPGLVEEVKLKCEPVPQSSSGVSPAAHTTTADGSTDINGNGESSVGDDSWGSTPWTVHQSTMYKMRLLAVSHSYIVADGQVLPYQAHAPHADLIDALQEFPKEHLDLNPERMSMFNPCPPMNSSTPPTFEQAVAPYAVALQIGAKLSGFWCLTDNWEFKFTVRAPQESGTLSLPSAIVAAGRDNAAAYNGAHADPGSISSGPSSQHHRNISGPSNDISQTELHQLATRTLGVAPSTQTVTQVRYQGLWWGAERIWTDEFVRLKVPRRCLAPVGAENILPPSGPGKSVREKWAALGRDPAELGAGARGVFMRLDGLFVVDASQPDGSMKKECRASGMLYELADVDWEDPQEQKVLGVVTNGVGSSSNQHQPSLNGSGQSGPPFMPGPSPLKPSGLPNFDPAVPVSSTASAVLEETLSVTNNTSPNIQLSHPTHSTPYPLPPPPIGYKFRPILPTGHESVMSLSLLSGRYYPELLSHPLLAPTLESAFSNPLEAGGVMESAYLWALEGLSPGFYNSVDPTKSKPTRVAMVLDADREAKVELEALVQAVPQKMEEDQELTDELALQMDIDI